MKFKQFIYCGIGQNARGGPLLQWHITEKCNLRCGHCYQEDYSGTELDFKDQLKVVEQFKSFLTIWRGRSGNPKTRGHITVTGGEPFIRNDFPDLLNVLAASGEWFSFAILTNGEFIDQAMAKKLRALAPLFVQVSVEGGQETHDKIRGRGNFARTESTIKYMLKEKIRVLISFTAHGRNFREFPMVAKMGRRLGVAKVWSDRLIPKGNGAGMAANVLTPGETREFFEIMRLERDAANRSWFNKTEIGMDRALQFLGGDGRPYHCAAGNTLFTVQPNGDLYPCRRLPILSGNLMETPLERLYFQNPVFQSLRDRERVSEGCEPCFYSGLCGGGLKCLSYALTNDPFKADPGCWKSGTIGDNLRLKIED